MDAFIESLNQPLSPDALDLPVTFNMSPHDLLDEVISQTLKDELPDRESLSEYECSATLTDYGSPTESCVWGSFNDNSASDLNFDIENFATSVGSSPTEVPPGETVNFNEQTTPARNLKNLSLTSCEPVYNSPGIDSRFNDSLTGLLGSPPPDSPLANNPFFSDLQAILVNDCREDMLPQSLLATMTTQPQSNVFTREQDLQESFNQLTDRFPEDVNQLSSFYRYQAALVETERFRSLHTQKYAPDYQRSLNFHYDSQLHQIMTRVEQSLALLQESSTSPCSSRVIKPRPLLSKKSVKVMEDWYKDHLEHPYPTGSTVELLAERGRISCEQVKKWFANKRNRSNNTRTLTEIAKAKRKRQMAVL
ncbi:uncharacterized protein LOC110460439 isoform X2 [Mizuhopecten yessoensis]|uniref:uncharacterized protein LOC110460439 isoform X1 n=1 Tax=Mizuhopecten yessoensis TaxID=6573 RepID=UPI000B45B595|nr:uncharacterized protein LOC110460439 isoform X1 [Mizuhopecten yessoensis]XP_021369005.1 uncharacterized protein LOC110460439 isoform X2 [Mizuhopecten yessoensis]